MKKCYWYFPIEPLIQHYVDNKDVKPLVVMFIQTKLKTYEVALLGIENQIYMLRIMIPDVEDEQISDKDAKAVQTIKEHMASVLRITYDHEANISRFNFRQYVDVEKEPTLSLKVEDFVHPDFKINSPNIMGTFINTFDVRHQIKLLSDSQDKRIPLQYRYLSLYKLLELEFKRKDDWIEPDFSNFLSRFANELAQLKITNKSLKNYIHHLRNRCAHIKSKKGIFGMTELSNEDMLEIDKFLPLMIKLCATLLNEKYKDKGFKLVQW